MRILYSFPHDIGAPGIGTTAINQVVGLLERGHDVTVIATSAKSSGYDLPRVITTMMLGAARVPHRVLLGMDNAMAYHDARAATYLRREHAKYDVVHCWPGAALHTARVAAEVGLPLLREVPNTHTENAYDIVGRICEDLGIELKRGSSHRLNPQRLEREWAEYDAAFRLLAPSDHVAKTFLARGYPPEKLLRHQYGFDPKVFTPGPEPANGQPLRALFLGLVGPRKGLHVALEAWRRSTAHGRGHFAIFGRVEDGYGPIIAPYLSDPGVAMNDFTTDTRSALQASDVLVLPSFEEGSALVTYEAQGCGVVPLVSDAAGALCVDQVTALVHPVGDVDALAHHLTLLSDQPEVLRRMRGAVLEGREQATWAAAARCLEGCYETAREAMAAARSAARPIASVGAPETAETVRPRRRRSTSAPRDVVFTFWHETWTDSMQRQFMTPDRLVQTLLVHEDVGRLLIADPYRMGPTQALRRMQGRRAHPIPQRSHPTGVVSPLRLRRKDATGTSSLRRAYVEYDRRVGVAATNLGLDRPAIITTNPFYAAYAPFDWSGPVTYYAFDDWAAYDGHSRWWPDYQLAYQEIRRRGHRVCAVTQHLLETLDPTGPGLVAPNGIVPEEWQEPWNVPEWLAALPRPVILYTGAIHSRLDLDAVRQITERFPTGSVVFVGPVAHPEVAVQLSAIPGVHVKAPLSRRLIAGLTRSVDACIMPHRRNQLTESMSPLKVYEYCAAGRPSAATDISPVRNIHDHVVLVSDNKSFADGVQRALDIGPMTEADRQAFIRANSWRGRHDAILRFALAEDAVLAQAQKVARTG